MAGEIIYNSDEIYEAQGILDTTAKIFSDDMKKSLASNFDSLTAVGYTGINKLQKQTDELINNHNSFKEELKEHDDNRIELEKTLDETIKLKLENKQYEEVEDNANTHELAEVELEAVDEGQEINTALLTEAVREFSYSSKVSILKNILKLDTGSISALLTDPKESNILVYEIKQMLNDNTSSMSTTATDEEKEVQKEFIKALANEKEDILREIEDDTYLRGMPYYKKISGLNGINIEDLILDEKNSKLLTNCVKFICDHNAVGGMNASDIDAVKAYVKGVAENNKMSVDTLLTSANAQLLRRGV